MGFKLLRTDTSCLQAMRNSDGGSRVSCCNSGCCRERETDRGQEELSDWLEVRGGGAGDQTRPSGQSRRLMTDVHLRGGRVGELRWSQESLAKPIISTTRRFDQDSKSNQSSRPILSSSTSNSSCHFLVPWSILL